MRSVMEIGDQEALSAAVEDAFPGASISVLHGDGRFEVELQQHGLLRPLR